MQKRLLNSYNVSVDNIRGGQWGRARCEKGITGQEVETAAQTTKVSVSGIGEYCLIVMLDPGEGQQFNGTTPYTNIGAVCPKD